MVKIKVSGGPTPKEWMEFTGVAEAVRVFAICLSSGWAWEADYSQATEEEARG